MRAFARDQRGLTLIEIMVVTSVLAVVLTAIFSLSETTAKLAPNDDERALVLTESRTGLNGMTRTMRQATGGVVVSDYSMKANLGARVITYTCDVPHPTIANRYRCTRKEGTGAAVPVVDHVLNKATNTPVFTQNGSYVAVKLRLAAAGDRKQGHKHAITLDDGLYMRNVP